MRLTNIRSKIHSCPHFLCLYCHAKWNTIIFKTFFVVDRLCKLCHFLCIHMCFRKVDRYRLHQFGCNHVHHATRADACRAVRFFSLQDHMQPFFWCVHIFYSFLLCDLKQSFRKADCLHSILRISVCANLFCKFL